MNKKTIGNCPYCTKILFKEASFKDDADFRTVCPYCKKPVMVRVEKIFVITVKPMIKIDLPPGEKAHVDK